ERDEIMLARYRSRAVPLAVVAAAVLFYMVDPWVYPGVGSTERGVARKRKRTAMCPSAAKKRSMVSLPGHEVTGEASTIATSPIVSVAVIAQFAAQPARPV